MNHKKSFVTRNDLFVLLIPPVRGLSTYTWVCATVSFVRTDCKTNKNNKKEQLWKNSLEMSSFSGIISDARESNGFRRFAGAYF